MPQRRPVPTAIRFCLRHIAIGFGLATLLLTALFWADPGGVGGLLRRSAGHPWPTLLLWFFCGLTLSGVQLAMAVMLQDHPPDDDGPGSGTRDMLLVPVPITRRR